MSITNLNKPNAGSTGWGADVNDNFTDVENLAKGIETAQALAVDNLKLDGNTVSSTDTNGNINITPDGTGQVVLDGLDWPTADGSSGQNIKTDGSGNLGFVDASGNTLSLITTATASSDATIEFTSGIDSTYKRYIIEMIDVVPATDDAVISARISTDGGSTWKSGSSDYKYVILWAYESGGPAHSYDRDNDRMVISRPSSGGLGNASGESFSGSLRCTDPASSSVEQGFYWDAVYTQSDGNLCVLSGGGLYDTPAAIDGIQFLMSTGNISSGIFKLYGLK